MNRFKYIILLAVIFICHTVWAGPQTTTGLLTSDVITDVQYRLNAISASGVTDPVYSDTEMIQWINDGMLDIAKKTGCLQDTESVTIAADQVEYSLSNDYIEVKGVILNKLDGSVLGLKKGNIWSIGRTESDFGTEAYKMPEYWYEFDGKIGIYPSYASGVTLAASGVTTTASVYESVLPSVIASGETVVTPSIYDKALILYVEAQGHKKVGRVGAYQATLQEYLSELGIDNVMNEQAKETPEVVE